MHMYIYIHRFTMILDIRIHFFVCEHVAWMHRLLKGILFFKKKKHPESS